MPIYPRSISEGDFLNRASILSRNTVRQPPPNLISLPRDMYRLFNEFQLTESRLWPIKQYQHLVEQMRNFNLQLGKWKQQEGPQIKNLRMTYSFYENLYSRIKYVNSLSSDKQSAKNSLTEIIKWVAQQKPKVRGFIKRKPEATLKQSQADVLEQLQLQDMTQFTMRKRQMTPYDKMGRTAHVNFFPPKQRLLDYHKKQFIVDPKLTIDQDGIREARMIRTSSLKRTSFYDTKLRQTSTTFRNTKATFRNSQNSEFNSNTNKQRIKEEIKEVKEPQNDDFQKDIEIKQFSLDDPKVVNETDNDKIVEQEELVNQLIHEENFEEDEKGEDDEFEQQSGKNKYKKAYQISHRNQTINNNIIAAEQNIKDQQQSTLRRILKSKQMQIQNKLEDLNIKQKMTKWAKTASFVNQQINRKSQTYRYVNDFQSTEFKKKGFFQKRKQITEFDFKTDRAKTAEYSLKNVDHSCGKRKIDNALKNFGKYINSHVRINPISHEIEQNNQLKIMRATSLTALNHKSKRNNIGDILAANQVNLYNQEAENQIINLKDKLSKKLINISKKKIFSALTAVQTEKMQEQNIFPKTLGLLSNPFFPKHLYQTKKKKKK